MNYKEPRKILTEDEIYKLIKTHRNNNPNIDNSYLIEGENKEEKAIGLEYEMNLIKEKFDNVRNNNKCEAILITGMIGSGKSLLIRNTLLSIINTKTDCFPNLDRTILISNQSPKKTYIMNGFRDLMCKMFKALLTINNPKQKRYQINENALIIEGDLIFNLIYVTQNYMNIPLIEKILNYDFTKHYVIISGNDRSQKYDLNDEKIFQSEIEKNKSQIVDFFLLLTAKYQKHVLKEKPLFFIIEDCHLLDSLSVEFIKTFIRCGSNNQIKTCIMLCSFQSLVCGLKTQEREKNSKINIELEEAFNSDGTIISMRPFTNHRNIIALIQFNVTKMLKDKSEKTKDPYEEIHIDEISTDVITSLLPLSYKGNPLFLIELTQSLLNQNFLFLKNRTTLSLSEEFKTMLTYRDYTKMQIPSVIQNSLSSLATALKPPELAVLKHASVIGNIFDIDTLSSILVQPSVTFEDLIEMIKNFEAIGIIEILYDIKPKRIVCIFAIPLFRETLYLMIDREQKPILHARVARKMQFMKFSYMGKECENNILQRHLEAADRSKTIVKDNEITKEDIINKNVNNIGSNINEINTELLRNRTLNTMNQNNINLVNLKILTTKEIIEKLKIIDLKITSQYSSVKKQFMPMLLSAIITKKDEHGGKVEERFAVLTNTKFCYYYYDSDYTKNSEPLASFYLKNIYQITVLNRNDYNEKKHYMEIKVSSWYKKDVQKEDRTFLIGFDTRTDLYKWEISLNFLRIKNMYDEFTSNFGMIQLPLNHEFTSYEQKKVKRKLQIKTAQSTKFSSGNMFSMNKAKRSFLKKKTLSNVNTGLVVDQEKIEVDKNNLNTISENVNALVTNGLGLLFAKIQETLYTQKLNLVYCPSHLKTCDKTLKLSKYKQFKYYTKEYYNVSEESQSSESISSVK